jgi:hypothetical protein
MRNLSLIAILCLGASASVAAGAVSSGGSGGGHSSGGSASGSTASSAAGGGAGGSHSGGIGVRGGDGPRAQRTAAAAGGTAAQTKLSADFKGATVTHATVTHATVEGKPVQLATLKCPPLSDHAKKVLRRHGWIEYFPEQNQPYYCHDRDRSDPRFGERDCFRIVN